MSLQSGYNPNVHHRRTIRLQGYDYSRAGLYFITICVHNRQCLFGDIVNNEMMLNDAGNMIEKWYGELENKFQNIHGDEHIVMPNHFHCIVEIVGVDLRVCPDNQNVPDIDSDKQDEKSLDEPDKNILGERNENVLDEPDKNVLGERNENVLGERNENTLGEHIGSPLHRVVQWFKTMTTNEYIRNVKNNHWPPFDGKLWQRNYYEHIIRDEKSYNRIREYIINNPLQWQADKLNSSNPKKS
jgi:putative transposase